MYKIIPQNFFNHRMCSKGMHKHLSRQFTYVPAIELDPHSKKISVHKFKPADWISSGVHNKRISRYVARVFHVLATRYRLHKGKQS